MAAGDPARPGNRVLQFGAFELRTDSGELRKHGVRVRLQSQPLQMLLALLEHPGEVVTREQMRNRLWPADTFVDFESGLNTAANRLRMALGDSAELPRFIETLPRIGYRFIAPVQQVRPSRPVLEVLPPYVPPVSPPPGPAEAAEPPKQQNRNWTRWWMIGGVTVALVAFAGWASVSLALRNTPHVEFHQITFKPGDITSARFAADGSTVLYTRADAGQSRLYLGSALSPESRMLDFQNAELAAVSRTGELALICRAPSEHAGILKRSAMTGDSGQEIARGVTDADWAPDGEHMALIMGAPSQVQYPAGKVLVRYDGWVSGVRVSPDGTRLAFFEHPKWGDDAGRLRVVDRGGRTIAVSPEWASAVGLAWAPDGKEVWFTASKEGLQRSLRAMNMDGQTRTVAAIPGTLRLLDVSRLGHVLLCRDDEHMSISGVFAGSRGIEDLPGFDYSQVNDISRDGNLVLFTETGNAGGSDYGVYLYDHRSHTTTRLGHGQGLALSADGQWALALNMKNQRSLSLMPLAAGEAKTISGGELRYQTATFFPDGRRLLATGAYPGRPPALYVQAIDGMPQPLAEFMQAAAVSPDSKFVLGRTPKAAAILSLDTRSVRELPEPCASLRPVGWSDDGRRIFLTSARNPPWKLFRADIDGGRLEEIASFTPRDASGRIWMSGVAVARGGAAWAYSYARDLSQLYVVDGWLNPMSAAFTAAFARNSAG